MTTPVIHLENLAKRFGSVKALNGVTFDVPERSVFALIGPNGAGKTTAIKTIMNILRPTSGRAEVLGTDSRRLNAKVFEQIGYVSENQQLPEWMDVGYFLSYCKEFYPSWNDEEAAGLLRLFELPMDRPLRSLSRGMRIKAAFASSLAYRPRLLVLDEPFSGLDVLVRDELIGSMLERELTVFISSHDLSDIETFASHVAYIHDGRLRFVEELSAVNDRFREVEVTLDKPPASPADLPGHWLSAQQSGAVIRFIDSQFHPERTHAEVRQRFSGVQDIGIRAMPLRSIFVALAKSAKR
jgi:ABC-2 type transport system ATP-binding protein